MLRRFSLSVAALAIWLAALWTVVEILVPMLDGNIGVGLLLAFTAIGTLWWFNFVEDHIK